MGLHFFRKQLFLTILFFFTGLLYAAAQKNWTLQECIEYALKNNIQIKQNELNTELSKQQLIQDKAALLPNVNGNANHNYGYGRYLDPFTNQFIDQRNQTNNFSLSSNVILFNGLQLQNTLRQSQLNYVSGRHDVEKIKNDISLNIAAAYLQILLNQELLNTSMQQLEVSNLQAERTEKLVNAGSLTQGNLLDVESQVASEELNVVNARNQLDLSYLSLSQIMDIDSVKGFSIYVPDFSSFDPSKAILDSMQIFSFAEKNLPEIKSADTKVLSAEKAVAVARGGRSPRLMLNGSYGTGYSESRLRMIGSGPARQEIIGYYEGTPLYANYPGTPIYEKTPFKDQLNDNLSKSIGISLSIPFFNGWQVQSTINRSKISLSNAKLNAELVRNQVRKSVQQSYADALAAGKRYKATEKSLLAMREAFKYTEQRYAVGLVNSFDMVSSKNNLNRVESQLLQAKYDAIFKQKVLDFYQGKMLAF